MLAPWKKNYDKPRQHIKSRDTALLTKIYLVKATVFSTSHVQISKLDLKEWSNKNWCFWTVVLEKTLESPLDCKKIKPVNPKGNQPWIFIGRTDAEAPILWPPDAKSQLNGRDPDASKDWEQEEKGAIEDEMFDSTDRSLAKLRETVKDREAWRAAVHGIAKSRTQLSEQQTMVQLSKLTQRYCWPNSRLYSDFMSFHSPPFSIQFRIT